jgi:hypothetical protein
VSGLALPVRCTTIQGFTIGSCSYSDFCNDVVKDICGMTASNCPPEWADYGIDCNCPFEIPVQTVDEVFEMDVPDFNGELPFCPFTFLLGSFVANGDFNIKITVSNSSNQHVACFRFLYTMKSA